MRLLQLFLLLFKLLLLLLLLPVCWEYAVAVGRECWGGSRSRKGLCWVARRRRPQLSSEIRLHMDHQCFVILL